MSEQAGSHIEALERFDKLALDRNHSKIYTFDQLFHAPDSLDIDAGAILAGEGFDIFHDYSLDTAEIPLDIQTDELIGRFALRYVQLYPHVTEYLSDFHMSPEEQGCSLLRANFSYHDGDKELGRRTAAQGIKVDTPAALERAFSLIERIPLQGLFNIRGSFATYLGREVRENMPPTETSDPELAMVYRAIDAHPELAFLGLEAGLHRQTLPTLARWATKMLQGEST